MGRWASSPPTDRLVAGVTLPSAVGTGPPHHAIRGNRRANLIGVVLTTGGATGRQTASSVPTSRRRDLGGAGRSDLRRARSSVLADHAAAASSLPKRNSLPSSHMRCKTTASFLASATVARFMPRRLATSMAQRFNAENRPERVKMTFAASYNATRTVPSPTLLIPPVTSVSPDWYFLGVRPKWAPTARDRRNRAGS